jgi:AbrB family looped-hinge helix DNA binding protein
VTTTISSKGQIVLPAEIRKQDRIIPGQTFTVERIDGGRYLLERTDEADSAGVLDWLLACPAKNWFQPVASESTASL